MKFLVDILCEKTGAHTYEFAASEFNHASQLFMSICAKKNIKAGHLMAIDETGKELELANLDELHAELRRMQFTGGQGLVRQ